MSIKDVEKWVNTAKKGRVDFFQKRKTVMEKSATPARPIFDYIARKI